MDNELKEYFDRQFRESREQLAEFRREVDDRFKGVDEKIRETHISIEGVRGLVEQVAEGVVAVGEQQRQDTRELKGEIAEVRDLLVVSYRDLDQRLRVVESS